MITLNDIRQARERIQGRILRTPLLYSRPLSERFGAEIFLKADNLQITGAFKLRGAMNLMMDVRTNPAVKGVVGSSSGNFAQAVSAAARAFGLRAVVVMPEKAPAGKVKGVRELGGEVVFGPEDPAPRNVTVKELEKSEGLLAVSAFDDERMIAGNGSGGLEIMEDLPDVDMVLVPVSGGGLISGVSAAIREIRPATKVYGVQGAGNGSAKLAFEQGRPVTKSDVRTIADGLIVRRVGEITFPVMQKYVEDILLAPEEMIPRAMITLLTRAKLQVEAAGAVGLAALMAGLLDVRGKKVVLYLSGGNVDLEKLREYMKGGE